MNISIKVEELSKNKLFLNEEFGSGEFDGDKFHAMFTIPGKSIIVEYRDKRYMINSQDILRSILEKAHEKNN